ncbi:MAG: GTP cyclohydrolase I FolE [Propionibacteriaceae bacterium]|nr:GTP cyclohydrolase I FolE [Propionibacteriaceae bacterium]
MPVDQQRIQAAIRELLLGIGDDPEREGLADTPARVARACAELFEGMDANPAELMSTTFDLGHDEMILVKDIEVWSMCEHHLLPFAGKAHVAYIPSAHRITGLSKIARLVDSFAKRLQVQERLTSQIADAMVEYLNAQGVLVVLECEHLCMTMRGAKKPGSLTVTSAVRGILHHPTTRAEAMGLIRS